MNKQRRLFLKNSALLSASVAFSFGSNLAAAIDKHPSNKVALLYASRYGSTRDTAEWIIEGIGNAVTLIDIEQADTKQLLLEYDTFILGSGVWTGGPHSRIRAFTRTHASALEGKVLGVFVVCGTIVNNDSSRRRVNRYIQQITEPLKQPPEFQTSFGGRIVVEQLSDKDKTALTRFYRDFLKKELQSWDKTSPDKAKEFGAKLKQDLANEIPFYRAIFRRLNLI